MLTVTSPVAELAVIPVPPMMLPTSPASSVYNSVKFEFIFTIESLRLSPAPEFGVDTLIVC